MSTNPDPTPENPQETLEHLSKTVSGLPNAELLATLDVVLLELERRLLHYAQVGPEMVVMADEGLVLSSRAAARLSQAQSASAHAAGHLQIVGVGDWKPRSTAPSWSDDPRVTGREEEG